MPSDGLSIPNLKIRHAHTEDWPAIWAIFREVIAGGDSFAYEPDTDEPTARSLWSSLWSMPPATAYVAEVGGRIAGSYYIRPNQPGLGSHVANAGFMVSREFGGHGIGRAMGEHAILEAKRAGYLAMQFNYVVSTNERAVKLWRSLGFEVIGTIPKGFRHCRLGLVDVLIMHQVL
jgi:ribosomal protein S18 acetylase RimI-like enzyme